MFVQPGAKQGSGTILITGAVGDFGTTHGFQVHGKTYSEATLQRGQIEFNLTTISNKVNKASPKIDAATCSGSISVSAPVPIVGGTGLYAGISGTATITESFGFIGPRYKTGSNKGQCNMSNSASAQPIAEMASVHGVGTVSF